MKRRMMTGGAVMALGLCHCGGDKLPPEPEPGEEQLDPYRSPMADRINAVLYGRGKPEEMLAALALLGVGPGKDFEDFKDESGIDDWFEIEAADGAMRQVSLTCGLSPELDADGRIASIHRSRKRIDDRLHEEMKITPD